MFSTHEEEDLDDLRYIEAHKHEPLIPLEQALEEIGVAGDKDMFCH